jgi:hypothetical protein
MRVSALHNSATNGKMDANMQPGATKYWPQKYAVNSDFFRKLNERGSGLPGHSP